MQNFQSDVYWVADNRAKGISRSDDHHQPRQREIQPTELGCFSEADIIRALESAVQPFLKPGAQIVQTQLKKWRYSVPLTTHPQEYTAAQRSAATGFSPATPLAGADAWKAPLLSGLAAGEAMAGALASAVIRSSIARRCKPAALAAAAGRRSQPFAAILRSHAGKAGR